MQCPVTITCQALLQALSNAEFTDEALFQAFTGTTTLERAFLAQHFTIRMQEGVTAMSFAYCMHQSFTSAAFWLKECGQCDLTASLLVQHFTIKMQEGVVATSYAAGDKFFIDPYKLLPMDRFLPKPKGAPSPGGRGESELSLQVLQSCSCEDEGVCRALAGLLTAVT